MEPNSTHPSHCLRQRSEPRRRARSATTVLKAVGRSRLKMSMENGRVRAPFLSAWVSEDDCAPDLRGHQRRLRPTAIPPALECRSATRFTPRLRAASRLGDDARPLQLHPDVTHMRRVSPPRVSLYSILGCKLKKSLFRTRSQQQYTCRSGAPRLARGRLTMQNRKYSTRGHM